MLPFGIPNTCAELESIVRETFRLQGNFTLHYKDNAFGEFFSLTSTDALQDKGTIKVVQTEQVVVLNLTTIDCSESADFPSIDSLLNASSSFGSSDDTVIISTPESHGQRSEPWPSQFEIPEFAYDTGFTICQ